MLLSVSVWTGVSCDSGDCSDYQTVIEVGYHSEGIGTGCTQTTNSAIQWRCATLQQAIELKIWKNTCIRMLNKTAELTDSLSISSAFNFKITSTANPTKLNCSGANSGLSFFSSCHVIVESINFESCGHTQAMIRRVKEPGKKPKDEQVNVTTTLFFEQGEHIAIKDCSMWYYRGYAIILTDCSGKIELYSLDIYANSPVKFDFAFNNGSSFPEKLFGGGVLFQHISEETICDTDLKLENCEFQYLKAVNPLNDRVTDNSEQIKPFGLGGSISIYLLYSRNTLVQIYNPLIHSSYALYGGGMYIAHGLDSYHNFVAINLSLIHI